MPSRGQSRIFGGPDDNFINIKGDKGKKEPISAGNVSSLPRIVLGASHTFPSECLCLPLKTDIAKFTVMPRNCSHSPQTVFPTLTLITRFLFSFPHSKSYLISCKPAMYEIAPIQFTGK